MFLGIWGAPNNLVTQTRRPVLLHRHQSLFGRSVLPHRSPPLSNQLILNPVIVVESLWVSLEICFLLNQIPNVILVTLHESGTWLSWSKKAKFSDKRVTELWCLSFCSGLLQELHNILYSMPVCAGAHRLTVLLGSLPRRTSWNEIPSISNKLGGFNSVHPKVDASALQFNTSTVT